MWEYPPPPPPHSSQFSEARMLQFDNLISFRMSVQLSDLLIRHLSFFVWELHISSKLGQEFVDCLDLGTTHCV